ncbi:unnamed protein product [Vitrella brassicaformis CCMP3155]|uniref:Uncharacterized protein n=1 Tax=Vitrella brassicaformis (strain CCMP3155) TaxID=1169540 RepID=A0A0G4GVK3_VITBC|nr:unnamed protein product [Vitrella brassicaformis CCMP3155]|eukprot:CEM34890.1 unnamed protein product [Vitrella brassicaformis CCMP3155]
MATGSGVGKREATGEAAGDEVPTLAKLLEGRTKPRLQHDLTASLMRIEADALLDEFGEEPRDRARLRSCRGPGASGWLTTVPAHPGLRFTNEDFVTCCRLRIGATQHPSLASDFCSCGTQLDPYGDHLLCCGTGNERIWRHDLLCEEWRRIIRSVQIAVDREVNLARLGVYPATTDPDGKRIDLYWVEEGKGRLGDVTITHPTRPDPLTNRHRAANTGKTVTGGRLGAWDPRQAGQSRPHRGSHHDGDLANACQVCASSLWGGVNRSENEIITQCPSIVCTHS